MADVQWYFEQFHNEIKTSLDEKDTLRQKRDAVRRKVETRLPAMFAEAGEACPYFEFRDQGSYKLGTGVLPLNRDFDIDLGLYFQIDPKKYEPVQVKRWVLDVLEGHTPGTQYRPGVQIRRPCVTVQYHRKGEPVYHVDIAVYADGSMCRDGKPRIALGKDRSKPELRTWAVSNAQALSDEILGSYSGDDLSQFRRVVRYLKRWRDIWFSPKGNGAPLGIALTVAAHEHFVPKRFRDGRPNDLAALKHVANELHEGFLAPFFLGGGTYQIKIKLPVEPFSDLCARMTPRHKRRFYEALDELCGALDAASRTRSEESACESLRQVFRFDG